MGGDSSNDNRKLKQNNLHTCNGIILLTAVVRQGMIIKVHLQYTVEFRK